MPLGVGASLFRSSQRTLTKYGKDNLRTVRRPELCKIVDEKIKEIQMMSPNSVSETKFYQDPTLGTSLR